ncbi:hypothetical protein [Actinacidiphila sp. ITFR-21]|uniref:hypothetical protein n=1 Tax=Actinacidiphila sp. ITFR-21 TaxID=3075199 RepID=UPI00288C2078|nr:hypothetical protein [Streptomyces sp. ITFR-21]WNI20293.1 hypothetical protein RLT57_33030 [Streptomyces sp. ITFR-21]
MTHPTPAITRSVLYVSQGSPVREDGTQQYPSVDRAATITELDPDDQYRVGLAVTNPTGLNFRPLSEGGSLYDASGTTPGSWHWPERV